MLSLDDTRWDELKGGYRMPFDPRPMLSALDTKKNIEAAWRQLWENLHHQGDVGEASFATVPHLVKIYKSNGPIDWNTYAMVGIIELSRGRGTNPDVPDWLQESYYSAIKELAELGAAEILRAEDPDDIRAILCIIAIFKGARTHARLLLKYSLEEMLEFERRFGS